MVFREIIAICKKQYETHKYSVWVKCNWEPTHTHIHTHTHTHTHTESDHWRHTNSLKPWWRLEHQRPSCVSRLRFSSLVLSWAVCHKQGSTEHRSGFREQTWTKWIQFVKCRENFQICLQTLLEFCPTKGSTREISFVFFSIGRVPRYIKNTGLELEASRLLLQLRENTQRKSIRFGL